MNFLQRTPFARLLLALATGIVLFQFVRIPLSATLFTLFFSFVLIGASFLIKTLDTQYKHRWIFGVGVFLLLMNVGYLLCTNIEEENRFSALQKQNTYKVELISSPVEKTNSYQCKVRILQSYNDTAGVENEYGKAIVYIKKDTLIRSLIYGDRLLVYTEFQKPESVQNPGGFDYAEYLERQGIMATAYVAESNWKIYDVNPPLSLRRLASISRNNLLNIYRTYGIGGDEFAVLAALTLGYTDELQPDLRKNYSAAGAMHVLAISGLHVGIIFVVLNFLLRFLKKTRKQKIIKAVFIILFLWIYAFITGLSPAVTRASLMFSFVSMASMLERKPQIYNTIFMSAFLMLLFKPNFLFEIGFQLSYTAVISIVFFQPFISKWFTFNNRLARWSWSLIAVSVSAQLGTAPFTLYYFHQFPNFFLLANFVVIPLASVIIYLSIALLVFSFVPFMGNIAAFLLKYTIWFMNFSIEKIQSLPFSISNISLNYAQLIFVLIAIISITSYCYNKKYYILLVGLFSLLFITSSFAIQRYKILTDKKLIVFSDYYASIINFVSNGKNYVFTNDTVQAEKTAGSFWKNSLVSPPLFFTSNSWSKNGFTSFQGKKLYILTDNTLKNRLSGTKIEIDYLILSNRVKVKPEDILANIKPTMIIVDKSISAWYRDKIKERCIENGIEYYSVSESGALVLDFK